MIAAMARDVERYLADLKEMNVDAKKDLEEKKHYYAVSMIVFAVMNRAIDIGNEVISGSKKIPLPGTYRDTFELLAKHRIITPNVAEKMNELMIFRNVIAHEYYELSKEQVYKLKKDMPHVEQFISEIKNYLKKA